jgi:outer membrane protein assembly factor BamB
MMTQRPFSSLALRAVFLVATLSLTAGCDTLSNWFKSSKESKIPGERISILALEGKIEADRSLSERRVELPRPYVNAIWSQFAGSADHAVQHLALGEKPVKMWKRSLGEGSGKDGKLVSYPVIAGGFLYGIDAEGTVTKMDAKTGDRIWSVELAPDELDPGLGFGGGVAYDNGKLFVTTGFGISFALDAKTGKQIWHKAINVPLRAAPVAAGGRVYVSTHDNQLFALSADDGHELWNFQSIAESAGILAPAAVAVSGDTVVAPFSSGELVALRAESGKVLWTDQLARSRRVTPLGAISDISSAPVIDRGRVFAISHGGRLVSIDLRTGERAWTQDIAGVQTPWIAGDYLFVVTVDAQVLCLSRIDGRIKWISELEKFEDPAERDGVIEWSGPVLAGDRLILVNSLGQAITLSPYTGARLGRLDLPEGTFIAPIVANQILYFVTDDADLIALR